MQFECPQPRHSGDVSSDVLKLAVLAGVIGRLNCPYRWSDVSFGRCHCVIWNVTASIASAMVSTEVQSHEPSIQWSETIGR